MSSTTTRQAAPEHLSASNAAQARHIAEPPSPGFVLPDQPLVTIEARRSRFGTDLRDLWAYRELLYFLTWRDVKVRYKQTALGIGWIVLQPLLMTLIFTLFLGKLARVPSNGIPYPLLAYTGLLPWTFFSSALASGGNSIVSSAHLITKIYFPRLIIPGAAFGARLVDFAVSFVILAGLMIYYGVGLTGNVLALPALVLLVTSFALGVGLLISALNVKYRDVGVALPVLIQLWMFASPVVYPASLVPEQWRSLYALNPLVGIIDGFRVALLGGEFDRVSLAVSSVATVALLISGAHIFRRMERIFADVV